MTYSEMKAKSMTIQNQYEAGWNSACDDIERNDSEWEQTPEDAEEHQWPLGPADRWEAEENVLKSSIEKPEIPYHQGRHDCFKLACETWRESQLDDIKDTVMANALRFHIPKTS